MYTPEEITILNPNEVFVFGSNLGGSHIGGAAALAYDKFGAVMGIGEGLIGQSYAFPTLREDLRKFPIELEDSMFQEYAEHLARTARSLPSVKFYLTKVGCGIAGYNEKYMKQFFVDMPSNIIKPKGW